MRLIVLTPEAQVLQADVAKLSAEAPTGAFTLLPRHVDIAAALAAGILTHVDAGGRTGYIGHDDGTLVKCGDTVTVAVRRAVAGDDLSGLRRIVAREFLAPGEQERLAQGALARLEAGVVRRMLDLEKRR